MRTTIPLLKDHHHHPCLYAVLAEAIDLRTAPSKEAALHLLADARSTVACAHGWDDSRFDLDAADLDPLPPTVVINTSLHRLIMNRSAENSLAEQHAEIVACWRRRDWVERHFPRVLNFIMRLAACSRSTLTTFFERLLKDGVWHAEEMSVKDGIEIDLLRDAGLLGRTRCWADLATYGRLNPEQRKEVWGVKLFADGSLGAKTAAISSPFSGGETGIGSFTDEELLSCIRAVLDLGKALAIHAVGDEASAQVIRVLAGFKRIHGVLPQTRIEHCQFITREDAERAKRMGVGLSMQPNFSGESLGYRDRLPERLRLRNNPFRMLIDEAGFIPGKDLLLGSDGMPHGAKVSLEAALFPPLPSQRLTLAEVVAGYCMPDKTNGALEIEIHENESAVNVARVTADESTTCRPPQ
jgi:predicted amidohydrolase YtcJ